MDQDFFVELRNLSCRFSGKTVLNHLSLCLRKGEFFSLLGPSGCGKTTTLRILAGLEVPSTGSVWINGNEITALPPESRGLGYVFQNYALFPHLNVWENVAFGCRLQKLETRQLEQAVCDVLELVRLGEYGKRQVFELSGGQQQRVALARALAIQPQVLLLDEPFSNLDSRLRIETREQVREIVRKLKVTTVLVTHDREEAFALSDRLAVMEGGEVKQVGTPLEVYFTPQTVEVARFWNDGNCVPLTAVPTDVPGLNQTNPTASHVFFRSEDARLAFPGAKPSENPPYPEALAFQGVVHSIQFTGASWLCAVSTPAGQLSIAIAGREQSPETGRPCYVVVPTVNLHFLNGAV
ncbi:MAG TPA: ABC transporter ATP-binding protein [Acidobacteriota bacterium]|nr:ABC transporter ATP-binding protein [Acidobacteriota bacterium]